MDIIAKINAAQVRAGEEAVIQHLREQGLSTETAQEPIHSDAKITQALFLSDVELQACVARSGKELQDVCHQLAEGAGWWIDPVSGADVRSWPPHLLQLWVGTKIALIHSEASEALEGSRKDRMDDHLPDVKQLEAELVDVLIRTLDLMGGLGMNAGVTMARKLAYNAQRADHKMAVRQAEGGKAF